VKIGLEPIRLCYARERQTQILCWLARESNSLPPKNF
jgi:hypothetical protein